LYGDLPGTQLDTQPASTATATLAGALAASTEQTGVLQQPDEATLSNFEAQSLDLVLSPGETASPEAEAIEGELAEELSIEDAFWRIADIVGKKLASPRDVVMSVSAIISQAEGYRRRTTEQHQQHMAQQIQVLPSLLHTSTCLYERQVQSRPQT
jgi:hypothetical protein